MSTRLLIATEALERETPAADPPAADPDGRHVAVHGLEDPTAFAFEVADDSMAPRFRQGDVVVCSGREPVRAGDCALVEHGEGDELARTFRRVHPGRDRSGRRLIVLVPLNPDHDALAIDAAHLRGAWPVVRLVRAVR